MSLLSGTPTTHQSSDYQHEGKKPGNCPANSGDPFLPEVPPCIEELGFGILQLSVRQLLGATDQPLLDPIWMDLVNELCDRC